MNENTKKAGFFGKKTYARQFDSTVTAFWRCTPLPQMLIAELAPRSLNDSDFVGTGVVTMARKRH